MFKTVSKEKIIPLFMLLIKKWKGILFNAHPELCDFEYKIEECENNSSFRAMVINNNNNFVLLLNRTNYRYFTEGIIENLAIHEVCGHMVHLSQLSNNKNLMLKFPHLFQISIHTQDSYLTEFIAQLIAHYLQKNFSNENDLIFPAFTYFNLQFAVRHYNVTRLIEEEITLSEAVEFHTRYLIESPKIIANMYKNIVKNTFFSAQVLNYSSSIDSIRNIMVLNQTKQYKILMKMLTNFYTHIEIDSLIEFYKN